MKPPAVYIRTADVPKENIAAAAAAAGEVLAQPSVWYFNTLYRQKRVCVG